MRGQRLEIGAYLVADVAIGGDAVGADDDEIDHDVLHQMAAGIVGDHRMRHAMMAEFPGGERGALVARARLVDPDMDGGAPIMRQIDRRRRRAPVDGGKPAGVAMGQDVDGFAGLFPRRDSLDQADAMTGDVLVDRDVLLGDFVGARIGGGAARGRRKRP